MAKKSDGLSAAMDPGSDEWQTRDDVQTLMRADEVHADHKRHKRAVGRLASTLHRITKKPGRSGGRSSGR